MTMTRLNNANFVLACTMTLTAFAFSSSGAQANANVVGKPKPAVSISKENAKNAQAQMGRTLTKPEQLTPKVRAILNADKAEAHGTAGHPFTTKRASAENAIVPVDSSPWRATGKLFMKFGDATYVCTASVIDKALLVTAAHCVHFFGEKDNGFADAVTFEPARHEDARPFGVWTAKEWWIPKVYWDGTDKCSKQAPGTVCENDIAVIVVEGKDGKSIADVTGKYGFKDKGYGYIKFLGEQATQVTQLGYPSGNFDGDKMIRTDSLGYQDDPNNVVIGSNQTAGSSGGPWFVNFGTETSSFTGTKPFDDESSQIVATTSWGYTNDAVKAQGASRFSKNTAYTAKSNIRSLVDSACGKNPGSCED